MSTRGFLPVMRTMVESGIAQRVSGYNVFRYKLETPEVCVLKIMRLVNLLISRIQ